MIPGVFIVTAGNRYCISDMHPGLQELEKRVTHMHHFPQ